MNMTKIVLSKQPCPVHGGSDSVAIYEDGSAHCFNGDCNHHWVENSYNFESEEFQDPKKHNNGLGDDDDIKEETLSKFVVHDSGTPTRKKTKKEFVVEPSATDVVKSIFDRYQITSYKRREISKDVIEFYRCRISYNPDRTQKAIYYGYNLDSSLVPQAFKKRVLPKDFSEGSVGEVKGTFGRGLFSGGKRLIITEGEDDAMVIQEAYFRKYGRMYPVQSLRSSTGTKDLIDEREDIRKFTEVVLWLDNDAAGEKALKEAAKIIGYDKVKVVKCAYKDAGEVAEKESIEKILLYVYDAVEYSPAAILNGKDLWERVVNYNKKPCIPYPPFMKELNDKLGGIRFGEIALWTSGTGSGKSTLMREIVKHLSKVANLISLDEDFQDSENYKKLIELAPTMVDFQWETIPKIGIVTLEESPEETARKLAGMVINRNPAEEDIPIEDLKPGFDEIFSQGNVMVLDHQGSIDDGSVMDHLEYMCLKGAKFLFVDHITILVSEGADGLTGNEAIDKVMNDILRLVKKYDVWVGLISHLRKTPNDKKSFEQGKIPDLDDIKGSGSIKQISFDVIAFARDQGSDDEETRNTVHTKVLKCRYTGKTGPSGSFHYEASTGRMKPGKSDFDNKGEFLVV